MVGCDGLEGGTCPDLRKHQRSPSGNEQEVTLSITPPVTDIATDERH